MKYQSLNFNKILNYIKKNKMQTLIEINIEISLIFIVYFEDCVELRNLTELFYKA